MESAITDKVTAVWIGGGVYPAGESWRMGDSPVVGLLLDDHAGHYTLESAPRVRAPWGEVGSRKYS